MEHDPLFVLASYRLWSFSALRFETILSPKDCLEAWEVPGHLKITWNDPFRLPLALT
jgi:hypothetical protein